MYTSDDESEYSEKDNNSKINFYGIDIEEINPYDTEKINSLLENYIYRLKYDNIEKELNFFFNEQKERISMLLKSLLKEIFKLKCKNILDFKESNDNLLFESFKKKNIDNVNKIDSKTIFNNFFQEFEINKILSTDKSFEFILFILEYEYNFIFYFLIESNLKINFNTLNKSKLLKIQDLILYCHDDSFIITLKYLIKLGYNINLTDSSGDNILQYLIKIDDSIKDQKVFDLIEHSDELKLNLKNKNLKNNNCLDMALKLYIQDILSISCYEEIDNYYLKLLELLIEKNGIEINIVIPNNVVFNRKITKKINKILKRGTQWKDLYKSVNLNVKSLESKYDIDKPFKTWDNIFYKYY